ncbi:hypothetical protein ASC77_13725 [Nocardioides sp. Root1257]|uniref:hypothetical protein n=1 Tax=unclassified Nocardioides TaxID=2615069 RepID=UPI00070102CD|nr:MULTISPECIES: hypothetical protein [unclassified Nocardioides]KQW47509.1 hypothetical protein ASC77_13725 [Nocardioides sp. Root1257]KRC45665.1 hypothetical protein ASE24_13730 [Nocardioides sp. Root224]
MTDDERMGTLLTMQQKDDTTPAWEPRAVTRARGLSDLLVRRPELAGVYSPADVTAEAVRWSA